MPGVVCQPGDFRPGDLFVDCRFHPCLCYDVSDNGDAVFGISLLDGSTWQCSIVGCRVRKLTPAEAWQWKSEGPALELALASGRVIAPVTEEALRLVLAGEDFATLGFDPHYFLRCAKQRGSSDHYVLEYRNGSFAQHFQALDRPLTYDRVCSAFLKYLRRDSSWQSDFRWERAQS